MSKRIVISMREGDPTAIYSFSHDVEVLIVRDGTKVDNLSSLVIPLSQLSRDVSEALNRYDSEDL